MTSGGFEPPPFRTSALNWRLRPLGQLIFVIQRQHTLHHTLTQQHATPILQPHQTTSYTYYQQQHILRTAHNNTKTHHDTQKHTQTLRYIPHPHPRNTRAACYRQSTNPPIPYGNRKRWHLEFAPRLNS